MIPMATSKPILVLGHADLSKTLGDFYPEQIRGYPNEAGRCSSYAPPAPSQDGQIIPATGSELKVQKPGMKELAAPTTDGWRRSWSH